MRVILLKDVPKTGQIGSVKEVSDGYALNYLFPRGLAKKATPSEEEKLKSGEKEKALRTEKTAKEIKGLEGKTLEISGKTNEKGHLFAGIGAEDIAVALERKFAIKVSPEEVMLSHSIKETGEHEVPIRTAEASIRIKVLVQEEK